MATVKRRLAALEAVKPAITGPDLLVIYDPTAGCSEPDAKLLEQYPNETFICIPDNGRDQ